MRETGFYWVKTLSKCWLPALFFRNRMAWLVPEMPYLLRDGDFIEINEEKLNPIS